MIGSKGCTFANIIVANGQDENRVFYINFEWDEEDKPYDTGMSFLTWYEGFFQEIINGNNVTSYGYYLLNSEQQLMDLFYETTDKERQEELLDSFFRFYEISPQARSFLLALYEEDFAAQKLSLLLRHAPQQGLALFERLIETKPHVAIMQMKKIPQDQIPRFYEQLKNLLHTIENGSQGYSSIHENILYAMKQCPQFRAADIVDFVNKEGITEIEKRTFFYVMGEAPDKKNHLEPFIHAMQTEPSWVARAAIEGVENICSPKLKPVLLEIWERYKNDSLATFHLKRAFESNGMKLPKK